MANIDKYVRLQKSGKITKGLVTLVQYNESLKTDILVLDLEGTIGIITKEEAEIESNLKSLVSFVGQEVSFVVLSVEAEKNLVFGSRKAAQAIQKEGVIDRLANGEVFKGTVINVLNYGAYIDIGGVSGLLKNVDFSEDYVTVGDVLSAGDEILVKLKKVSSNDKIVFEAVEKHEVKGGMSIDMFEPNQVVLGTIRNVKAWGAYVRIATSLDALCPIPPTMEIEEGLKVQFKIQQVDIEKNRVRGKILRIIG